MLTIYKASAGSGKTYTLTRQYLTFLLGEKVTEPDGSSHWRLATGRNRHRQILAITFTNKATAEMKERIVSQLSHLAGHGRKSDYVDHLTATLQCSPEQLKEHAQRALNEILFDYENFNVSTIDSFFQQVLRSLAFELDHPGDFSVEIEESTVLNEGIRRLMSDFNGTASRGSNLESIVCKLMTKNLQKGDTANFFNRRTGLFASISKYAHDLFNEHYKLNAAAIDPLLHDPELRKKLGEAFERHKNQALADLRRHAERVREGFTDKQWAKINNYAVRGPVAKFIDGELVDVTKSNKPKFIECCMKSPTVADDYFLKGADKVIDDLEGMADMLAADMRTCYALILRYHTFEGLVDRMPVYEFMAQVQKHIDEYRLDNGVVVLADTNSILKQVMMYESDVPFVYEKMAMRLEHFLIDEFQDTSRMQWDNLSPMVHNSVAYGNDNLIIGDEKQAIYRFRNSDSSMLHHDVAADARFAESVKIEGMDPSQNTNWRSAPEVVLFNNRLFGYLAEVNEVPGFENVEQGVSPKNSGLPGFVSFEPYPEVGEDDDTDPADAALDIMVENIRRQHADGYAWSDIAVISNRNDQCETVVRRLQEADIPVATDEGLYLSSSPLLRMIVSAMQLVYTAASKPDALTDSKGKQVLFKIHFEFEYARLLNAGADQQKAMQQAIERVLDKTAAEGEEAVPRSIRTVIDRQPSTIVELAETVLRECMLRAPGDSMTDINSYDLTAGQKTYMAAFCDAIDDYVEVNGNDLGGFLKFWNDHIDSLKISGARTGDMVSVMTIHKSKGLEYPCVHVPYLDYPLEGRSTDITAWVGRDDAPLLPWDDPDIPAVLYVSLDKIAAQELSPLYPAYKRDFNERVTDGLNKSYVALTRPQRELCGYFNPATKFGKDLDIAFGKLYDGEGYDPDTHTLTLGAPTHPKREEEKPEVPDPESLLIQPEAPVPFYAVAYNDAADGVTRIAVTAPGDPEPDITSVDDDDDPEAEALRIAADRGTRLHLVLSRVAHRNLLRMAVNRFKRLLSDDDISTLNAMFEHPDTAQYVDRWFARGTKAINEVTVSGGPDHDHPFKRIDRLVYLPDGSIEVIDFKFTASEDREHQAQVADYVNLVRLNNPGAEVRGYLWYADLHRVIEVSC